MKKSIPIFSTVILVISVFSISLHAAEFPKSLNIQSLLIHLIKNHEEIKNLQSQVEQAKANYSQSKGLYYPTVDVLADAGGEDITKEYGNDTSEFRYNASIRASQLITDFGKTTNSIKRSDLVLEQTRAQLDATRQQLMLDGIKAYINIVRARERLKSARRSESRIKELTGIEETLVDRGAGLSSDVLQAKSQLSGAMATRVEAQGELSLARNRFQAVFYHYPTDEEVAGFKNIAFPDSHLPSTLQEAVDIALEKNPELLITAYNSKVAQKDIDIAKTAFFPQLNLFAQALTKDNDEGALGYSHEYSGGIEFRYNLFSGGSDKAAMESAIASKKAITYHNEYIRRMISEQVRNSWEQFTILSQKSELLDQQADIVQSFLELAIKERKMGTRSLLDVLSGEINHINAISTSIAARQDTKIAAYNLLFSMGNIGLELFE